jgi:hypothetical protein
MEIELRSIIMKKYLTLMIILLTLSLVFTGCGNGTTSKPKGTTSNPTVNNNIDSALNGTWVDEDYGEINFSNGNFIFSSNRLTSPFTKSKGTYNTSGKQITVKLTHVYIDNEWYSKDELRVWLKKENPTLSDEDINANLYMFSPTTQSYSISDNKLTLGGIVYNKK